LVLAALTALMADAGLAAKLTDKEHTRIEEPRPTDVPSDAELEAAGAVIGRIDIDIRNIFDESDPRENVGLFRAADRLHIRTKRSTVKAQLLFASGERYSARKLAETERNLRLLRYVYDARVVPVHYADGRVDIQVITKDVWTLSPGVSFGRAGGSNASNLYLEDTNFLGWGKKLDFEHVSTVDRTSDTLGWADPNVFGSRWTSQLAYSDSSDGSQRSLMVARPFYSLDTTWSATINALSFDRTVSRYNLGNIVDQFNDNQSSYELSGGISGGLVDGWARRITAGMRYDRNLFAATPGTSTPALALPSDRTLSYPFVGFEILEDRYAKIGDQDQIGRTEDLYFGTDVSAEIGLSNAVFGADRDAIMLAAKARRGFAFGGLQTLFLTSDFASRVEQGRARNLIADASAAYYWRWDPERVFYVGLATTVTDALDPDMQLLIGGDNGLRGYPLRYESGTSRALLTVEQRFYTDWFPFRLVRVGGALFGDVGRTWGRGAVGNSDPGLLRDIGFGLRLGNSRSGLGNVLHIDVAFPLDGVSAIDKVQFLIETKQSF
jgi:outer membrane protein assembly factor BamA